MLCWIINVPCGVVQRPSLTTGGHILDHQPSYFFETGINKRAVRSSAAGIRTKRAKTFDRREAIGNHVASIVVVSTVTNPIVVVVIDPQ